MRTCPCVSWRRAGKCRHTRQPSQDSAATGSALRIPRGFYDDHCDRLLAAPEALRESKLYVWIRSDDRWIPELYSDADFYATMDGENRKSNLRLVLAAERLLYVLQVAGWSLGKARALYPDEEASLEIRGDPEV